MNRIVVLLVALSLVASACQNKTAFTIDGTLRNAGNLNKVRIFKGNDLVDSAVVNEKGEFRFRVPSPEPDFFYIVADAKNYLLLAQNGDKLKFSADYASSVGDYEIEGSSDAEKLKELNKINGKYGKVFIDLKTEFDRRSSANPGDREALMQEFSPKFDDNMKAFSIEVLSFAEENKDNLAGFYAMSMLDQVEYEEPLLAYAQNLKDKFPGNKPVQDFIAKMNKVKPIAKGQPAIDFQGTAPSGHIVKLSDFKGKYVLLDFWASWCVPCRQENPNIVKQYHAFKDKNFTVFGVSLDGDRADWIKAIEADKLDWPHVSELNQWNSEAARQYQVSAIPASFLIDPSGKIIAKNLRGGALEEFLKKTLN
ncbi:redoxin domain-containing protein [Arcticibacter sp.]|uniref:redoxin domain-containing protein n=1 Tax=Arcticibacter sp. TaxID=1872630 RepID=UPI00388DFA43